MPLPEDELPSRGQRVHDRLEDRVQRRPRREEHKRSALGTLRQADDQLGDRLVESRRGGLLQVAGHDRERLGVVVVGAAHVERQDLPVGYEVEPKSLHDEVEAPVDRHGRRGCDERVHTRIEEVTHHLRHADRSAA